MSTRVLDLHTWLSLDKTNWRKLIIRWNRKKGYIKHVTNAPFIKVITSTEIPTRLPYVHGSREHNAPDNLRRVKNPDPTKVYVDEDFMILVERKWLVENPYDLRSDDAPRDTA